MGALPKPHCHWEQPGLWWAKKFVSPSYSFCMTPDYTKKNEVLLEHCHENLHPIYTKLAISRSWTKYIRGGVCSFAFFFSFLPVGLQNNADQGEHKQDSHYTKAQTVTNSTSPTLL